MGLDISGSTAATALKPNAVLFSTNCDTSAFTGISSDGQLSLRLPTASQSQGSGSSNRTTPDRQSSETDLPDGGSGRTHINASQRGNDNSTDATVGIPPTFSKYILLCFDVTKLRMNGGFQHECRLRQVEVKSQDYDRVVLGLFRNEYYAISGTLRRYLSMRALAQINFVKVSCFKIHFSIKSQYLNGRDFSSGFSTVIT